MRGAGGTALPSRHRTDFAVMSAVDRASRLLRKHHRISRWGCRPVHGGRGRATRCAPLPPRGTLPCMDADITPAPPPGPPTYRLPSTRVGDALLAVLLPLFEAGVVAFGLFLYLISPLPDTGGTAGTVVAWVPL